LQSTAGSAVAQSVKTDYNGRGAWFAWRICVTDRTTLLSSGIIFDIRRFSIHDGPGIRTTVFFKGCPLNCWWCHNPESQALGRERIYREERCVRCGACVKACGQGAISFDGDVVLTDAGKCTLCGACVDVCYSEAREILGREMTVAELLAEIERDVAFYDESGGGLTVSGGEPLMQPDFLLALLRACREHEIHTVLDTCGFATWDTVDRIRSYVDLFLYDIKLMDDALHHKFTGVSNELILSNLLSLSEAGHNIVLRLPVIPGMNDDDGNLHTIGDFAAALAGVDRVDILPYHHTAVAKYERLHRPYGLREVRPPSDGTMTRVASILRGYDLQVKIGG
jgi:pyruvate formate lyase activating enzyme